MLVVQTSTAPANIRHALVDLAGHDTTELRVASAYVTRSGSNVLLEAITNSLGKTHLLQFQRCSSRRLTSASPSHLLFVIG